MRKKIASRIRIPNRRFSPVFRTPLTSANSAFPLISKSGVKFRPKHLHRIETNGKYGRPLATWSYLVFEKLLSANPVIPIASVLAVISDQQRLYQIFRLNAQTEEQWNDIIRRGMRPLHPFGNILADPYALVPLPGTMSETAPCSLFYLNPNAPVLE